MPSIPDFDLAASVTFDDILTASRRIDGVAHRTPVLTSRTLDEATGAQVFLKCEGFQRAGAFKFRGAYNALAQLPLEERRRGVLTFSSGNHAQAIALSGRLLGIPATVIMPEDAPHVKLEATRGYGAEVVTFDRAKVSREELGARLAEERGLPIIPPYDHPHVIAGQGTAALELLQDVGELDLLLAPCGGGGLLSGSAIAVKALSPSGRVIGVEPEQADDAARSFRTGLLHSVSNPDTIADGARTPSLGRYTFPLVLRNADDMVTVSDASIVRALRFVWERMKVIVEPTGALALAALMDGTVSAPGSRAGVILSGANADFNQAASWFSAGG